MHGSKAVPIVALVLAGCLAGPTGPSPTDPHPSTTTTAPTTTTTLAIEQGLANYRACLGEAGVSIGEIPLDGLGRPDMTTALSELDLTDRGTLDALEACGPHLSSGALDSTSDPELRELVQRALEEFAECLRERGVDEYPDPVDDFDGIGSPFPVNRVPWTDPALPEAVAVCGERLERGSP